MASQTPQPSDDGASADAPDAPVPSAADPIAPVEVDFGRVMAVGIVVWLVALVVTTVLWLTDVIGNIPVAVSATGAVLGVLGWDWARRHRAPR
ncbi:MAG: hypothetical protein AAGC49_05995 [Brevundimonas sp.]